VIALGDFNFRPDKEQYARTTMLLDDTWTLMWPEWVDDEGHNPREHKIDHIVSHPAHACLMPRS
jgi:hypothetical protein